MSDFVDCANKIIDTLFGVYKIKAIFIDSDEAKDGKTLNDLVENMPEEKKCFIFFYADDSENSNFDKTYFVRKFYENQNIAVSVKIDNLEEAVLKVKELIVKSKRGASKKMSEILNNIGIDVNINSISDYFKSYSYHSKLLHQNKKNLDNEIYNKILIKKEETDDG